MCWIREFGKGERRTGKMRGRVEPSDETLTLTNWVATYKPELAHERLTVMQAAQQSRQTRANISRMAEVVGLGRLRS